MSNNPHQTTPCSFCGKDMGAYESKLYEPWEGGRVCCVSKYVRGTYGPGCAETAYRKLSAEEQAKFIGFTDG